MITLQSQRVPHADGAWPTPRGYIYGAVDTRIPGYGLYVLEGGAGSIVVPGALYSGTALLDELQQISMVDGQSIIDVAVGLFKWVTWTDRLGELLGFARPPGSRDTPDVGHPPIYARSCSPMWLPYIGAKITSVEIRRELHTVASRMGRAVVSTWGAVRLVTWEISLWGWAAPATSWYRTGAPIAVVPTGGPRRDGYVLSAVLGWSRPHRDIAVLTLIVAEEVS